MDLLRCRLIAFLGPASLFVVPVVIAAQTLNAGCHYTTAAEKQAMIDRGIPYKFEVCPADEKILGIGRDFEQWYSNLKTVSPCNKNSCTFACKMNNTGAQVCGPTSRRWNSIGCHPNNNTAIFPTVSHGFAAHIELLRRYCGERGRCTIGRVIEQWTGVPGDRPAYANFVSKASGMPINQVFNPNDIDLMGRMALAMSCFEAGSMPYNADELKKGLIMAGGGARVPVPANVGQILNEALSTGYSRNPSGMQHSNPGSWAYPQSTLGSGTTYNSPTPPSNVLPIISQSSVSTQQSTYQSSSSSTVPYVWETMSSFQQQSIPVEPAALIIAQPAVIVASSTAVVSWTSVGMDRTMSCQVIADDHVISQGSEGTILVITGQVSSTTKLVFTLNCRTLKGALMSSEASVTVVPEE